MYIPLKHFFQINMHRTSNVTLFLVPLLFSIALAMPFLENGEVDDLEIENIPENYDFVYSSRNGLGRRSLSIDPKYVVTRRVSPYNFGLGKRSNPAFLGPELNLEKLYEDLYQGNNFFALMKLINC